jgi:hypothetical protein
MPRLKYSFLDLRAKTSANLCKACLGALIIFLGAINQGIALERLAAEDWDTRNATHLLERTGFGATPEDIKNLSQLSLEDAVNLVVDGPKIRTKNFNSFVHSGVFDIGLDPFPPSRPATTNLAEKTGEALGIKVRPDGNRPLQPIVDKFFYWLRASRLETDRVTQWWGQRMLVSDYPLQEKMALFWHGHFATNEDKVRDYRKMLQQLELFHAEGLGDFRTLMIAVSQNPAMLMFLDAGVNIKSAPNENFAREIVEIFTMGVGHYTEHDVREAARTFTGWNFKGLSFEVNASEHDNGNKTFLGHSGNLNGVDVIDIILQQKVTSEFIAGKIYRFLASQELTNELKEELGIALKSKNYQLKPFLKDILSSQQFYSDKVVATRIKSPVELVVSTYRKLGLENLPGAPDFNYTTGRLGQRLMHPPTVAGWSYGKSWITPSLIIQRSNFIHAVLFPDIAFIPWDRYPDGDTNYNILSVHKKIKEGLTITDATKTNVDYGEAALSNQPDRNEEFNTRFGSYRGWQMAIERVKPIERDLPEVNLTDMVLNSGALNTKETVTYLVDRFLSVPLDLSTQKSLSDFLEKEIGTQQISQVAGSLEYPLRLVLHLILSLPEYQLG